MEERQTWQRYVLDSPDPLVYPASAEVLGDASRVRNLDGLLADDDEAAVFGSDFFGDAQIVIDLGVNVGGRVEIGVSAVQGGPLRVAYSEDADYLQPLGDMRGVQTIGINDDPNGRVDVVSTPGIFHSPGIRGAQRYLRLSLDGPGQFTIDFVRVKVRHLRPGPEDYVGRFLSSDPVLNRIWYSGDYTLHLGAVRDPRFRRSRFGMADGGKRDRLIWIGDLAMQSLVGHYTVRQLPKILERSIRAFSCQQLADGYIPMASDVQIQCPADPGPADGPPSSTRRSFPSLTQPDRLSEYTAWWVVTVCDRYLLTGDAQGTRQMLKVMRRAIDYMRSKLTEDGLFRTPQGSINWRAFDTAGGTDGHTNATWVRALRRLAFVEREIGDATLADEYLSLADSIARAMRRNLFDERAGLFVVNGESPRVNHAQDANVEALLSGVVRGAQADTVLEGIRERLWKPFGPLNGDLTNDPYVSRYISPFMTGWEVIARLARHSDRSAAELMRRVWGGMLKRGPGTMWEAMAPTGAPVEFKRGEVFAGRTSLAHGWSAAPTYALSAYVAGIRPLMPGWKEWLAEPQRSGLSFAQAQAGTPAGPVAVRWRFAEDARALRLTAVGPKGTSGTVAVPLLGQRRAIARDGEVVWRNGKPVGGVSAERVGDYVQFEHGAGIRTYAWAGVEPTPR